MKKVEYKNCVLWGTDKNSLDLVIFIWPGYFHLTPNINSKIDWLFLEINTN